MDLDTKIRNKRMWLLSILNQIRSDHHWSYKLRDPRFVLCPYISAQNPSLSSTTKIWDGIEVSLFFLKK